MTAGAFDAGGNAHERLDAAQRVAADGSFAGEHECIGFLVGGVHHIGDFGAGGSGLLDHRFQQVGGNDHAGSEVVAALDDAALEDREFFEFHFGAEVAAGDHDHIRFANDRIDVTHGFLVLDFGDDLRVALERLHRFAKFADMGCVADE